MAPLKVLVCGGGNGAHILAGLAASRKDVECSVLTLYADEAERWTNIMSKDGFKVTVKGGPTEEVIEAKPSIVTKDPAKAVPGATVIMLVVPAFAHNQYFEAMKPYLEPGTVIVGLPGQSGFEFAVRGILGDKAKSCLVISFETLPWACRIQEFGKHALVIGTKKILKGAMCGEEKPTALGKSPIETIQYIIGDLPELQVSGHLLGMTLIDPIHPGIMFGRWHDWDGKKLDHVPLFYQGVDEPTGELLHELSNEMIATKNAIIAKHPEVDLNNVRHMVDWYLGVYGEEISDKTSIKTMLNTNKAYDGLTHPTITTDDGKCLPDFKHRYLSEDLPFCLIVLKGIALLAGVQTPKCDMVILWCQKVMNKEWLVDGKLTGKDMASSRAPQRYNFTKLEEIL